MVKQDIAVTILLRCMCVRVGGCMCGGVHVCIRICWGHNSYIYDGFQNYFNTVVVLEEEKCHLKHSFR